VVSPCAPGAAGAALQRPLGDPPPAGGAGPGLPAARFRDADQEIEPHFQAREDGTEHHGPLGARSAARLRSIAPRTSSQRGPNYAGQGQEDGCQGHAEAHADRLSKLVRLEFRRPLCRGRGRHVARCTPVPGARRALLDRGLKGGSQVWFLVPSKRSTRLRTPRVPVGGVIGASLPAHDTAPGLALQPRRVRREHPPGACVGGGALVGPLCTATPTCTPHEPPAHR
jgi:hypothetical protein